MTSVPSPATTTPQDALDQAVARFGAPGIAAEVRDGRGTWFGSAGFSDTATGLRRQPSERFRIGSTTKAFTAAVVLLLAAEGRLGLDDTVERWLPGLVAGNGHNGRTVTLRQLLHHTSGIFNYGNDPEFFAKGVGEAWFRHRFDSHAPEELVRIGLATPPLFAPGEAFLYSNTNYFLAALIAERATGRTFAQELDRLVVRPLGLAGTSLPGARAHIEGPHPLHYSTLFSGDAAAAVHDATVMDQSFAWAAGGIVSTLGDLQCFFRALLGADLLPAAEQREMFTTVGTAGPVPWIPGTRYGLGVFSQDLPCGTTVWGNAGATYGSWTYAVGSRDGGRLLTVQVNGDWSGLGVFDGVLDAVFGRGAAGGEPSRG
ncbi:serine hydrolase domain-containing protein [Streptomyces lavendulae]|uniref:serine hydrolase domain-containing protein n=1 Tax=Streptomyces lavendulae TaxID=1914 RepID=UPI00249FE6B1|nr:serine hydrolase domain-containing protein [Streptomyces lavendulae]GLX19520.1 D-alanyl-D-alanine carboxypeptidase [Streptomyces lavendulae subsp. lavendulae]GLX27015.1 D-alanyl-D-alanine carboxypeptidase [Streptomyces lavendulae subsp. lavendulae]